MISRPKTFGEFMNRIQLVNRPGGGIKIMCKLKGGYVLLESKLKPWNTPATRKSFLANLYFKEVLMRVSQLKKIQRPAGYELLGVRGLYTKNGGSALVVIVDAVDKVDLETGEMVREVTICNLASWGVKAPFKTLTVNVKFDK